MSGGLYFKDGESDPHTADRINCNCEANVWAAQWWNDFIARDHCAKLVLEKKDARESFWNGEVPFCMDEPAFISMCQEYGEELVNDIGVIPLFDVLYQGRRYKPTPNIYPMVSCISNRSEHPEEAWDFLVWMSGMDAQNIIADCGLIPANKDYSSSDAYGSDYPLSAQFQEFAAQYGPPIGEPVTPLYARLREVMDEASMKMFSAIEVDVRPILNDAFQRMKDILNKT
ncbi:hypothetical protein SDC9_173109 [bioreactor metagenome]|uniref:Extracellular solute-binding protein n=1 Tax=bioreactor metagenome TaxID=1076179 RepID=A0A645GG96_9ZZZZ